MRTWAVILNPISGNGKAVKISEDLLRLLNQAFPGSILVRTEFGGHATLLTQDLYTRGFRHFLVLGGDGTINEVVNGLINKPDAQFSAFPAGTGNDWCRNWNIPSRPEKFIQMLLSGKEKIQDLGVVEYNQSRFRYFVNIAGCGFDGLVAGLANQAKKAGKGGLFTYVQSLLAGLYKYKEGYVSVETNAEIYSFRMFSCLAGIGQYGGGGMKISPGARPDDGLLEITLAGKISRLKVLLNAFRLFDGSFVKLKEVRRFSAKSIRLSGSSEEEISVQVDGEILTTLPITISVVPQALRILVPH